MCLPAGVASAPQSARAVRSGSMIPARGRKLGTGDLAFYSRALARVAALGERESKQPWEIVAPPALPAPGTLGPGAGA